MKILFLSAKYLLFIELNLYVNIYSFKILRTHNLFFHDTNLDFLIVLFFFYVQLTKNLFE